MKTPSILAFLVGALVPAGAGGQATDPVRDSLFAIEAESHQQWLRGEIFALESLMDDGYRFVAMNGALEAKEDVVRRQPAAGTGPRPLHVSSLRAEPQQMILRGDAAVVISLLHIDATVRGRPLPDRMRVLSVFSRAGDAPGWLLVARSITPILAPGEGSGNR